LGLREIRINKILVNGRFNGQIAMKSITFSSLVIIILTVFINTAMAANPVTKAQAPATPPVGVKAEASPSKMIVVGNSDSKRYHLPGMPYYNKVEKYHRVYFNSEQEAIDKGYYKAGTDKRSARRVSPASQETIKQQPAPVVSAGSVTRFPETLPKEDKPLETKLEDRPRIIGEALKAAGEKVHEKTVGNEGVATLGYKVVIAFILFLVLFTLPFLPAFVEISRKEDADPLFISMNNKKDPRYFGKSFKLIIQKAMVGLATGAQISEVMLSKKEELHVTDSLDVPANTRIENLLCVQGDIASAMNVRFSKDVYVSGKSDIGSENEIRVLASDGNMTIAEGSKFERWLDTQGDLDIGSNCHLGISASCGGRMHLADQCSFRRLYAMPITTGTKGTMTGTDLPAAWPVDQYVIAQSILIRKSDNAIEADSILTGNIIFLQDVRIGHHSVVHGSIKCYGDIELEENVTVYGSIFADGKITIGKGAMIKDHVFSQAEIIIGEECVISRPGVVKSVIGKRSIILAPNVIIYGYVSTEGKGTVI